jgi:DNA invertase Pin-like site-specific DNA recombinase
MMARKKKKSPSITTRELRIGVYIRVSSARQAAEGDSLEAQQNETAKYIEAKKTVSNWKVKSVALYVDAGRSAKDQNRPQLQRLKQDISVGKIDVVICFKLDRITRSLMDFVELWRLFEKHEVSVISLREDFDTSSVMGQALLKLIMVFAELERDLTAERTAAIMLDRAERGLFNGGYVYGYRSSPDQSGKLVVDPEWAPIIRERFFDAFERLGSAGAVQRELGNLGIWRPEWKSPRGTLFGTPRAARSVLPTLVGFTGRR